MYQFILMFYVKNPKHNIECSGMFTRNFIDALLQIQPFEICANAIVTIQRTYHAFSGSDIYGLPNNIYKKMNATILHENINRLVLVLRYAP